MLQATATVGGGVSGVSGGDAAAKTEDSGGEAAEAAAAAAAAERLAEAVAQKEDEMRAALERALSVQAGGGRQEPGAGWLAYRGVVEFGAAQSRYRS